MHHPLKRPLIAMRGSRGAALPLRLSVARRGSHPLSATVDSTMRRRLERANSSGAVSSVKS